MELASFVQNLALHPAGDSVKVLEYLGLSLAGPAPTCDEMAERWGVSRSTAHRLMKAAKAAPVAVVVK